MIETVLFNNCTLFAAIGQRNVYQIKRILVDYPTQLTINQHFNQLLANQSLLTARHIPFDGRYKPESAEALLINNFPLATDLLEAISAPLSVSPLDKAPTDIPNLKYLFIGNRQRASTLIAFQVVDRNQRLTDQNIKLFQRQGTFQLVHENGFSLSDRLDALYHNGQLIFNSYHRARRIFDLSDYYRMATANDLHSFITHPAILAEDITTFQANTDNWIRRKIALIQDAGTLTKNSVPAIHQKAIACGLNLTLQKQNGQARLLLPNDKKQLKELLKFLDEDIYKGILSNQTYETNSKLKR